MTVVKQRVSLFEDYTDVYHWIKSVRDRYIVLQGGTSSSKTYSIMQLLCNKAISERGCVIEVIAATAESLKVGAIADFKNLIKSSKLLESLLVKPNLLTGPFKFKNGSVIRFRNLDGGGKARYGKRDYLFLNEVNSIDYESARQLIKRTKKQVLIDYNPDSEFWVHTEIKPRKDCFFAISNFTHNYFVSVGTVVDLYVDRQKWLDSIVRNDKGEIVEENKYWRNQWEVYGLGLTGVVEGVVFDKIDYVVGLPLGMTKRAFGLDFGYSNDPTSLVLCGMKYGKVYGKELIYETGLTTPDLIDRMDSFGIKKNHINKKGNLEPGDLIIADHASPDAIAQMQRKGYNVVPCKKGAGSVISGINALRGCDIFLTSDSLNWIQERMKYKFKKVGGKWTNTPVDAFNHCWDAMRYWYRHFHKPNPRKRPKSKRRIKRIKINS